MRAVRVHVVAVGPAAIALRERAAPDLGSGLAALGARHDLDARDDQERRAQHGHHYQQADHQLLRDKMDSDHLRLLRERKWQMEKEFPAEARRPETVDRQIKDYSIQEKALEQKLGGREVQ